MSVQTDPVPPVPEHTNPLREDDGKPQIQKGFNHTWTRWFVSVREKINVLNETLVNLAGVTGTGYLVKNGAQWVVRTFQAGFGIDLSNADGSVDNTTITHADTSSVTDVSINNSNGIVLQDVTISFDEAGHVIGWSFGSVDLDGRYLQDAPSDGTIYGRQNGAWVSATGGSVPTSRTISTTLPLTGGGDLSADRTLGINAATTAAAGSMSGADKAKLDTITAGSYTPTLTGATNVASSTAFISYYTKIDSIVTVVGRLNVDPTGTGTTQLRISLPIASAFSAVTQLSGVASSMGDSGRVVADITNDEALLEYTAVSTANTGFAFMFSYIII